MVAFLTERYLGMIIDDLDERECPIVEFYLGFCSIRIVGGNPGRWSIYQMVRPGRIAVSLGADGAMMIRG